MGSQEPSSYRRSLQTPLRYSIRLQGWASRAPGERLHPSQLQLDEGLHWHGKRPSVPNCKYHTGVPGQARNKAKGSSTRGQRAQAWLRLVLRPHADVCSCRVSTWTCSASGWELLPEFCQGCGLEMLGSSHCTDPAHLPRLSWHRLSSGDLTAGAEGTPLDPMDLHKRRDAMQTRWPAAEAYMVEQLPSEKMERVCPML